MEKGIKGKWGKGNSGTRVKGKGKQGNREIRK